MFRQASLYAVFVVLTLTSPIAAQQTNFRATPMPPEFNWSLDEPIIREQIAAGMSKLRRGETPDQATLTSMVTWLSNTLDIPATYDLPRVERAPRIKLAALLHNGQFVSQESILSNYDAAKQSIYMRDDWNGNTPEGTSILLHEMVHHLQQAAKTHYECSQWPEKLAYVAQERWLGFYGRSLEMDFGIDPLTYLLTTECYIP